jgi:hypothetical protein
MYKFNNVFRYRLENRLEKLAQQVLGIELALLVMVTVMFLVVYIVR